MRRHLGAFALAALAFAGLATPATAHPGHKHDSSSLLQFGAPTPPPPSAYKGLQRNPGGPCGSAYEIRTRDRRGRERVGCTHGPDAAPLGATPAGSTRSIADLRAATAAAGADAGAAEPVACDTEDSTGTRVQAIYAHAADQPDRSAAVIPLIRQWAAHVETVFYESARETGGSRSVRWLTEPSPGGGCRVSVQKLRLTSTGDDSFRHTMEEMRNVHGLTAIDRRYLVWMDGTNPSDICGVAEATFDDSPGPGNQSNGSVDYGYYGLIGRVDQGCWGTPGESIEAHELAHTLGAVNFSAPNATNLGHCTDEWDLLCYEDDDGVTMTYECGTVDGDPAHNDRLDCGHDDYFSTAPPAGSYLATHWNVADNNFLREGRIVGEGTSVAATGDGDLIAEPGETVSFTARVRNRATTTASQVSGTVFSLTSASMPVPGARRYPDIPGGQAAANAAAAAHTIAIAPDAGCGAVVPVTVRIAASTGKHDVAAAIPTGAPGAPATARGRPAAAIPDNDPAGVTLSLPTAGSGRVADVDVELDIAHTYDEDLDVFLIGPDGTTVELFSDIGGSGRNFTGTVLDDDAALPLAAGVAPFTGRFQPEGSLAAFDGKPIAGTWKLKLVDDAVEDSGTVNAWGVARSAPACALDEAASWSAAPTTARGDVDGDGFSDLVVAAPGENAARGAVHVIYGSNQGLTATRSQYFTQDTAGIADVAEPGDRFGAAIAVGDVNGDFRADVAIGAPGEDLEAGAADAGVVHVLYGSSSGLSATGAQLWSQSSADVADAAENGDRFGAALTIGNLGRSADGDLAIGAPAESSGAGVVHVLHGAAAGLSATGSQLWSQDSSGIADAAEAGDRFGTALAMGNLGKTAQRELLVGVPGEDLAVADAGVVHVIYGAADGLAATGSQLWSQNSEGIADAAEAGDGFGATLATGDFGRSADGDIAIGVPDENLAVADAGAVHVVFGSASGLTSTNSQLWTQDSTGISEAAEAGDRFGAALAAADFGETDQRDLAIGVPAEDFAAAADAGVVHVVYGAPTGLTATESQLWSQDSGGIVDRAEAGDRFGAHLASGGHSSGAFAYLVVGVPAEDLAAIDSGVLHALYGTDLLRASSSRLFSQDTAGIADAAEAGDSFGGGMGR